MSSEVASPDYLSDDSELPQPVQDVPLWSENYFSQAWDAKNHVGVFFHFARMPFNYNVWEGLFTVWLPGDRFLVARDFAWGDNGRGPGANALRFEMIEPYKKWKKCFRGAARLVTGDQMRAGPLEDDSHVFVDVELMFDAISPVFDVGDMGTQFWAQQHYEQHCKVTGKISYLGVHLGVGQESYVFSGTGIRDHSLGARDIAPMKNHVWAHAQFPSGRSFMLMDVHLKAGLPFTYFIVDRGGGFKRVRYTSNSPLLSKQSESTEPYELRYEDQDGPGVIRAKIVQDIPYSFTGPNEWCIGTHPKAHHLVIEGQTQFEWDGEIGYGLTERSVVCK